MIKNRIKSEKSVRWKKLIIVSLIFIPIIYMKKLSSVFFI